MNINPNSPEIIEKGESMTQSMNQSMTDKMKTKEVDMNEKQNSEQLVLVQMLAKHNLDVEMHNNHNHHKAEVEFGRDYFERTASMLSYLSGTEDDEIMSKKFKYVTTAVLWFCYFSLALNDYIFGPTFDDLSKILGVSFEMISYFPIIRQVSYTLGALGGFAFNYVNRQLALILLLIISGFTLIMTPYSHSLSIFFLIGGINGFAAGACDIALHVWIIEMFEDGGGPLLQALHFAFGIGITIAPSITSSFLSGGESECIKLQQNDSFNRSVIHTSSSLIKLNSNSSQLHIPYTISAAIVCLGAIALLSLYCFKKYVPPKELKVPQAFNQQMPKELSRKEKVQLWRNSVPSYYIIGLICLGSILLSTYYGLEVTYFQFMAQFVTSTPLPISGGASANVEAATAAAYAFGGGISVYLSTRLLPQQMLYFNFTIINIGNILLLIFSSKSLTFLWIGNVLVGLGMSSTYASIYTFLEHQICVTNAIGSVFLFASGAGTAILPLFLSKLCSNPQLLIYLSLFCTQMSLIIFFALHIITNIRSKQIDMIKRQIIKSPAILLGYRRRAFSILTV